jgi:hypothetical protein
LHLQTILVLAATVVCLPQRALADEVDTCIAAAERGEPLKKAGRLREARADLAGCVREVCPRVVRDACREMTAAIDDAMPSVVVSVQDAAGHEIAGVRVLVDGTLAPEVQQGGVLLLDPGVHVLRAERPNGRAVQVSVAIRIGEKRRPVVLTMPDGTGPVAPPARAPGPVAPPSSALPVAAIVSGGIGVLGFGAFTLFGLMTRGEYSHLASTCGKTALGCNESAVDPVRAKAVAADVGLAVGIVGAGLGVGLWLARPRTARVAFVPSSTGLVITIAETF